VFQFCACFHAQWRCLFSTALVIWGTAYDDAMNLALMGRIKCKYTSTLYSTTLFIWNAPAAFGISSRRCGEMSTIWKEGQMHADFYSCSSTCIWVRHKQCISVLSLYSYSTPYGKRGSGIDWGLHPCPCFRLRTSPIVWVVSWVLNMQARCRQTPSSKW